MKAGEAVKSYYTRVFWGIIFIYFNINIGTFDILPNFIGYYLIATGLGGLSQKNQAYGIGKIPAYVMIFASLLSLLYPQSIYSHEISPSNLWMFGISGFFALSNIVIIYAVCKGVYDEAEHFQNEDLITRAKICWQWFFAFSSINMIIMPFILTKSQWVLAAYFFVTILSFICALSAAGLLRSARDKIVNGIDVNS